MEKPWKNPSTGHSPGFCRSPSLGIDGQTSLAEAPWHQSSSPEFPNLESKTCTLVSTYYLWPCLHTCTCTCTCTYTYTYTYAYVSHIYIYHIPYSHIFSTFVVLHDITYGIIWHMGIFLVWKWDPIVNLHEKRLRSWVATCHNSTQQRQAAKQRKVTSRVEPVRPHWDWWWHDMPCNSQMTSYEFP